MKDLVRSATLVLLVALVGGVSRAAAGDLTLAIRNGRVDLKASDVSARQILAEWARVGQTRILNGDRVVGPPLTLQLNGVPEREALDIILRSASGYMAVARPIGNNGSSIFDRILVMPSSNGAPMAQLPSPPPPRLVAPIPQPPAMDPAFPTPADEDESLPMDQQQGADQNGAGAGPNGPAAANPFGRAGFPAMFPGANRGSGNPNNVNIPALQSDDQPAPEPDDDAAPSIRTNPWNVTGGSSLPGVISPPQQPNPTSPGPPPGAD